MLIVYSKKNCGQCGTVKTYLNNKNIAFKEVMITEDEITDFAEKTKAQSFPVIEDSGKYLTMNEVFEKY